MTDIDNESTRPKGPLTISLLILGGMLILALASLFMLRSRGPVAEANDARAQERLQARLDLAKEDQEKMTSYGWVNKEAGQARLPVDVAVKILAPKLALQAPAPSGERAPLQPGPSDAPVPPAETPAAAAPVAGESAPAPEAANEPAPSADDAQPVQPSPPGKEGA